MEEHLIKKCRKQDRQAQKALYEHFEARMFRLCFRYLNQQQDTEDVLLAGFLKVFSALDTFDYRGPGSLEAWISRIMVNESLMALRRQKRLRFEEGGAPLPEQASQHRTDGPLNAEDIYNLIRALPDGYRTVFNLYAIEGYKHEEIADQLGISPGTSKSQLSKARALLQEWLSQNGIHHENEYRFIHKGTDC
ncbi:MAG: sigma-70 family RNA polymerase sigma factor [Bacteroidia bacterium]|nr:sigma-70 family RNA polymerase sigma factor [Bacteroidia bacterium]